MVAITFAASHKTDMQSISIKHQASPSNHFSPLNPLSTRKVDNKIYFCKIIKIIIVEPNHVENSKTKEPSHLYLHCLQINSLHFWCLSLIPENTVMSNEATDLPCMQM